MFKTKLTDNFVLYEFFHTNQGLVYECDQITSMCIVLRNIIKHNTENEGYLYLTRNLMCLAGFLQGFRDEFNIPIIINSGYRCPELNKYINGAEKSKHMVGLAADITFNGYSTYKNPQKYGTPYRIIDMCDWLKYQKETFTLSELIFHDNYIHLAL